MTGRIGGRNSLSFKGGRHRLAIPVWTLLQRWAGHRQVHGITSEICDVTLSERHGVRSRAKCCGVMFAFSLIFPFKPLWIHLPTWRSYFGTCGQFVPCRVRRARMRLTGCKCPWAAAVLWARTARSRFVCVRACVPSHTDTPSFHVFSRVLWCSLIFGSQYVMVKLDSEASSADSKSAMPFSWSNWNVVFLCLRNKGVHKGVL
jgi:hypothetical protein